MHANEVILNGNWRRNMENFISMLNNEESYT